MNDRGTYTVYFDGNKVPGPTGTSCSFLIINPTGQRLHETTIPLPPQTTVPEAEYHGLIAGLEYLSAVQPPPDALTVFGDSQLVINQINGVYETRKTELRVLRGRARNLLERFRSWTVSWVPRDRNLVK